MVQPTRKRYVNFELTARFLQSQVKETKNRRQEAEQRWSRLTAIQRQRFLKMLGEVENASQNKDAQRRKAVETRVKMQDYRLGGRDPSIGLFMLAANDAANAYAQLARGCLRLRNNWRTLRACLSFNGHHPDCAARCRMEENEAYDSLLQAIGFRHQCIQESELPPDLPYRADGVAKIRENWLTERHKAGRARIRNRAFQHTTPHDAPNDQPGPWYGGWILEEGGQGATSIWVKVDQNDLVCDRRVVKEVFNRRVDWMDVTQWCGPNPRIKEQREPIEVNCQIAMMNRSNDEQVDPNIPSRNHYLDDQLRYYRFSMEYCPHGNLAQLSWYRGPLPEPFLWRVFYALAMAAFTMQHGHQDVGAAPDPEWMEIVHRDLKPENVFLKEAHSTVFPCYLTPVVGDFGAAMRSYEEDRLNPTIFLLGLHTHGFAAPEQAAYVDARTFDLVDQMKILSHTNIYGIGTIMYSVVMGRPVPRQPLWLSAGNTDGLRVLTDEPLPGFENMYTNELLTLIDKCLAFQPAHRPSSLDLLQHIRNIVDREEDSDDDDIDYDDDAAWDAMMERNPAQNMRRKRDLGDDDFRVVNPPRSAYRLGLALNELPALPR